MLVDSQWALYLQDMSGGHVAVTTDWPLVVMQHADSDGETNSDYDPDSSSQAEQQRQVGCHTDACSNNLCMFCLA